MKNFVVAISRGEGYQTRFFGEDNLSCLELESLFEYYFMINPKAVSIWNSFINDNFAGLDDNYYYTYEVPTIEEEDVEELTGKWLCYDIANTLCTVGESIDTLERYYKQVKIDKSFLDKLNF